MVVGGSFQYPVSDRLDCNMVRSLGVLVILRLSVSCVGSSGL